VRKGLYVDPPLEVKKVEQFVAEQRCITTRDELLYRTSVLKSSPLIESHPPLFADYQFELRKISFQERAEELLRYRLECFADLDYRGLRVVQLKSHFIELFNHTLNDLSLYQGIEAANTLDIIDELVNKEIFTPKTGQFLKEMNARLYMLRIKVQLFYDSAKEEILLRPIHSPAEAGTYVATPEEKLLLELTYFLIFIPLYNRLRQQIQPSFSSLEKLQNLDLIEELFQYLSRLNWTTERNLIESILKAFLKAPDYFNSGSHERFYQLLSTDPAYEPVRTLFIDQLTESGLQEIVNEFSIIPNRDGMRQSTRLSEMRFQHQLRSLVQPLPTSPELVCKVTSPTLSVTHYLTPAVLSIFEQKRTFLVFSAGMGVRQGYQTSAHSVFRYQRQGVDLHFKQKPSHPLMEYAVYNLITRIIGVGAPVTELARFELSANGRRQPPYPVLISETIPGTTIDALLTPPNYNVRVSPAHFTWMCLVSLLTRPGDGRAANYVVTPQGLIYCVDNDISLVEPIVRDRSGREVKFCSILFCLRELLDQNVLNQFCQLDIESILSSWIDDITEKEKQYCALFSPLERQRLYDEDNDNRFTPHPPLSPRRVRSPLCTVPSSEAIYQRSQANGPLRSPQLAPHPKRRRTSH
jgi:NLR family CARD domain-containing protein 3